jgi:hypothetical protein
MRSYRRAEWIGFRDEIIRLDDNACVKCGRGRSDNVVLQVHQKQYIPGRMPWEYPHDLCETLCKGCHAEEHGIIMPKYDWDLIGVNDLGDVIGTCECCGTAIRHVFLVQHEKWATLEVGETCCDNLTGTEIASTHMESLRRFNNRRKRFVSSRRWLSDKSGAPWIRQKNVNLAIVSEGSQFRLKINGTRGQLIFASILDAKMKAFEVIESGAVTDYFNKKRAGHGRR